jgi:CubicO group peptidase (beta-lactamase class C family)
MLATPLRRVLLMLLVVSSAPPLVAEPPTRSDAAQQPPAEARSEQPATGDQQRLESLSAQLELLHPADAPGLAVLAARAEEVLFQRGYGSAELAHQSPVTVETKFRIGSVTKGFTAAAILHLQQAGKLSLDDALDKYLPDFPRGDEVTIAQLLNHTSGIHSYTSDPEFLQTVVQPIEADELIERIAAAPFDFDPGTDYRYNNSAYFIAGELIARCSGVSYDQYLQQHIWTPLEMEHSGVHRATQILAEEAYGYSWEGEAYRKALNWDMSHAGGAGALYSTVGDLHRWTRGFFGGRVIAPELVERAVTANVLRPGQADEKDTGYGFGWVVDEHRGLPRYSHGGGLQGFSSHLAYYPDQSLTVVVLQNALPAKSPLSTAEISRRLAEIFLEDEMDPPVEYTIDSSVTAETMKKYVGRYDYGTAVMEVTWQDDQLYGQLTGQPRLPLFPASPTLFFLKIVDATVEFQLDEQGHVTGVRHRQGGNDFVAERIPEREVVSLSTEQLESYVGDYEFAGLGTLKVRRQADQLTAQLSGQPALPIFPTAADEFFYKAVEATLSFDEPREGKAHKVVLRQGGAEFSGARR